MALTNWIYKKWNFGDLLSGCFVRFRIFIGSGNFCPRRPVLKKNVCGIKIITYKEIATKNRFTISPIHDVYVL